MNIVWFVSSLDKFGGGERFVLSAASKLNSMGHDCKIITDQINFDAFSDFDYNLSWILSNNSSVPPFASESKLESFKRSVSF